MTAAEEYELLKKRQDDNHIIALAENARLKAEVASLRGITLTQREVDSILFPCDRVAMGRAW